MKNTILILSLFISSLVWGQNSCACVWDNGSEISCSSQNCGVLQRFFCLLVGGTWYGPNEVTPPEGVELCDFLTDISMPVEFGDYSLVVADGVLVFDWYTYSEVNCWKYEVEVFSNKSFFLSREIPGNGNVSHRIDYSTSFNNLPKDILYLRLKQIDYNGDTYELVLTSIDNTETKGVLVVKDLLGRDVPNSYTGVVIYYYSDGSTKKVYRVSN